MKNRTQHTKLQSCWTCIHNQTFQCTEILQIVKKHMGVILTPERTQVFDYPVQCKRWKSRLHLKCATCHYAARNEYDAPITCVFPVPLWAAALTGSLVAHTPITEDVARDCDHYKLQKEKPNATK